MSQASGLKNTLFVHFLTKAQRCYSAGLLAICCSGAVFPSLHSGGSWHIVFFSALHVFIWHNPTGRYSWSVLSWDPSRTNKHGRLHPAYADVPCLIHRWIWAVFLQQPEAVNLTESMSHTHTHMQTAHINADCQSPIERRDTTETNMSAPEAWAAIILSGKLLWCEGKKQQRLLIDSDSLCADWYQMCFRIITLMLWNLWKMKLNDSCSWCSTVAVLSPVNHPSAVFSSFLMEAVFTVTVIDSWKPSGRRPKTPQKGSLKKPQLLYAKLNKWCSCFVVRNIDNEIN